MSKFDLLKDRARKTAEAMGVTEYELYYVENSGVSAETYRDEISDFSSSVTGNLFFRVGILFLLPQAVPQQNNHTRNLKQKIGIPHIPDVSLFQP